MVYILGYFAESRQCVEAMGRITFYTVLALLVLQCSANYHRVWQYNADVRVTNEAADDFAAVWSIDAIITGQNVGTKGYVKFDDVKTALVNGHVGVPALRHFKYIPKESEAILKPFVIDYTNPYNITILHEPEDPVWSVNLKRAFANTFALTVGAKEGQYIRQTLYGLCRVTSNEFESEGNAVIEKIIDYKNCEDSPSYEYGVKNWGPTNGEHSPVTVDTKYQYYYNGTAENLNLDIVKTSSIVQYQSMPGVRSIQKVEQNKRFAFVEAVIGDYFEKIDVSKATVVANLTFDYSKGFTGGRDESNPEKPGEELIAEYNEEYEIFKKHFNTVPLSNEESNVTVYSMYEILSEMKKESLEKLSTDVLAKDDNLYQQLFLGYLPYLGTKDAAEFILNIIENQDEHVNDLLAIKILSTFPVYLDDHSEELVKEMEPLLSLKVSNPQVKYAGILSFATLVCDTYSNGKLEKAAFEKYTSLYYKHFLESEKYEDKMTYLLGLINLKFDLPKETMLEICINKDISHHLRGLAMHGFKSNLKSEGEDVYKHFWPIVQNKEEHHEVRVAALDVLLYSQLSYEQFQTIIQWYHDEFQNPDEQHLTNYLYTTIKSLENSTGYYEYLGDFATEAIQTMKPVKNDRVWTTGNYRMAFTDEDSNFGGSLQARLIANPHSNAINVGIFSFDTFAVSLNLGAYTIYVKMEGVPDVAFAFAQFNARDSDSPIQHLLELIKKHGYKIKNFEGVHITVAVFCDERAVYGMHINEEFFSNYKEAPLFLDLIKLVVDYNSLNFPLEESTYIVSDIGTSIKVTDYMSDLVSYKLENLDKFFAALNDDSEEVDAIEYNTKYRSMWTYSAFASCYNPLAEVSAETYKYIKDEKYVDIPYSFNLTDYVFKWKHTKDSFNWIKDHMIGMYIDEDRLPEYCSYCPSIFDLPTGYLRSSRTKIPLGLEKFFGVKFNVSVSERNQIQENLDKDRLPTLAAVVKTHKTNSFDVPFVAPIFYLWHAHLYNTFITHDLYSMSVRTIPFWDEPTEMVLDLDMDVNDLQNDKDPIGGEEFDFTIGLTNRKSHDAEVLTYFNATYVYKSKSESPDGEPQPHIEHSYDIKFYYDEGHKKFKACIDREILYPTRRIDKFSLDPVNPSKATSKIVFGDVEKISDECPKKDSFTITELYTATEKQNQKLESMDEYVKCKKEIGEHKFKYIPPTIDCLEAHKVSSKYDALSVYVDLSKISGMPHQVTEASKSEFGIKIFEFRRVNDTHVALAFTDDFFNLFGTTNEYQEKITEVHELDSLMLSPSVVAYDDHDLKAGLSSACYITPQQINTFYGKIVDDYHGKFGNDAVAFVECLNDTQSGLTVQKIGDNKVGFNFWSENNTLVASASEGKVKVVHNGKSITETDIKDEDFKIYFLDQDVIYVTNGLVDIQYSTEYLSVKASTIYNNYICGLCAGDNK